MATLREDGFSSYELGLFSQSKWAYSDGRQMREVKHGGRGRHGDA